MVNVVLDSDFLSAFLKIEALHRVREYFQDLGVRAVTVPAFLLMYRSRRGQAASEVRRLVEDLEEKDHYGFPEEIRRLLLKEPHRG